MDRILQAAGMHAAQTDEVAYLWPCNTTAWLCWQAVQTQWRIGMGGATGLDYAAVLAHLRAIVGLQGKPLRRVFSAIQAAEAEVLQFWSESRESERSAAHA